MYIPFLHFQGIIKPEYTNLKTQQYLIQVLIKNFQII